MTTIDTLPLSPVVIETLDVLAAIADVLMIPVAATPRADETPAMQKAITANAELNGRIDRVHTTADAKAATQKQIEDGKLQTTFQHIEFVVNAMGGPSPPEFICQNKTNRDKLGHVKYLVEWKQYCYFPHAAIVLNVDVLHDIRFFIKQLNEPLLQMTQDDQNRLNELLNDSTDRLSERETKFLESLDCSRIKPITVKQSRWLDDIWNRLFQ